MPKKSTPNLPGDLFDDGSAISRLTGGTVRPRTETQTQERAESAAAEEKKEKQNRMLKQTSFYLLPEQLMKLDDLAHAHYKTTGRRINRNDIVRYLVDQCHLEDITDL